MRFGLPSVALLILVTGCGTQLTKAKVTIVFENETVTKCVRVTAKKEGGSTDFSDPSAIDRGTKDQLTVAIGESATLSGEVLVTVRRFGQAGCSMELGSETKPVTLSGGAGGMVEFRFGSPTSDGGSDAGADAGTDGGCDVSTCTPMDCDVGSPACGCVYAKADAGTLCASGICTAGGTCQPNVCAVLPENSMCSTGLACVLMDKCTAGVCTGTCRNDGFNFCQTLDNSRCASPTECVGINKPNGVQCATGRCLSGSCTAWLPSQMNPLNLRVGFNDVIYPDAGWTLASPDGGLCDTVISTTGNAATVTRSDCGQPPMFAVVDDAGVSVMTMLGLEVGPNARLSFVGDRPAMLIVVGNATVNGIVSVAPLTQFPAAGAPAANCTLVGSGSGAGKGGGGAGFAGRGGNGGDTGGTGGNDNPSAVPLRAGCNGGSGAGGTVGGRGGGALELIVTGALTVPGGFITASGGGGAAGGNPTEGGGGGASGGTLILETMTINLMNGAVTTNGGGGGEGGSGGASAPGPNGSIDSGTPLAPASLSSGGNGGVGGCESAPSGTDGLTDMSGGGGGGSAGVIFLRGWMSNTCVRAGGVISGGRDPNNNFTCN